MSRFFPNYLAKYVMLAAVAFAGARQLSAASVEVFGGYAYTMMKPSQSSERIAMNGWNGTLTTYVTRRIGITADVSAGFGNVDTPLGSGSNTVSPTANLRQYSVMAGPQFRLLNTRRFETSVRALFGAAHGYIPDGDIAPGTTNPFKETTFAALFGSNVDFKINDHLSLRASPGFYLTQYGPIETQNNFRFSFGPVFRFGGGE